MLRVTLSNPAQKRTLLPKYAQTQATAYSGFLDPAWPRTYDIYPGSVMARENDEVFTLFTGATGQVPFGLSSLFVAPQLGIDEVLATGGNEFTVWTIEPQGEFEVLAPAFDQNANWATAATSHGGICLLTGTTASVTLSNGFVQPPGVLTPTGANNANSIAELISVETTSKILIRGRRYNFASTVALGTGS
jgi:hypothetical protein